MNITIVKSNKGRQKLKIDRYAYHLERKSTTFQWVCAETKSLLCKGRLVTVIANGSHTVKKGPPNHNHDPAPYEKATFEMNENVKNDAVNTTLLPSQIIRNNVVKCSPACRVYLPSKQAQKQKVTRVRATVIKQPESILNIRIPEQIRYLEGELFVLSEKSFDDQKIIVLGTQSSLKLLGEAQCWLMDATFEVVPIFMRQLFTIHGKIEQAIVPLLFCAMSSKTQVAYFETFYEICKLACEWNIPLKPKVVISDFEKASVSALKMFFPEAQYKGCLFHFGQIIWRKVQAQGCVTKYGNDENFSLNIRMLKSLALVPENEVLGYYKELKKWMDPDARKIGLWFEKNYLTGIKSKSRQQPKPIYSPNFWTVSEDPNDNFPRTQNSVESWHRRLQIVIGKAHIGLYQLVSELGKELICAKTRVQQIRAGVPCQVKKKLLERNIKISNVIKQRKNMDKLSFLKNIAHNMALKK